MSRWWVVTICILFVFAYILFQYFDADRRPIKHSVAERFDKNVKWSEPPAPVSTTRRVRIITPAGAKGTDADAEIYNKILSGSYVVSVDPREPETHPESKVHAAVNLYVERPLGLTQGLFPSDEKWIMINQEITDEDPRIFEPIDWFLCKSRFAEKLITATCRKYELRGKTLYTKHSSADALASASTDAPPKKNFHSFIHLAGKSHLKNTTSVLNAWLENDGFPDLGYPSLVITCNEGCMGTPISQILTSSDFEYDPKTKIAKHITYPILVAESLPEKDYRDLLTTAGFFICPSAIEGYGHYINEGRSAGAVVITTNAPPMNELIDDGFSGFVVPISHSTRFGSLDGSYSHFVSSDDIARVIRKAKHVPEPQLARIGEKARRAYLKDTLHLRDALEFLGGLGRKVSFQGK